MVHNYRGLFEEWEVAIAVRLVKDAMVKWECLRWASEDDLVQECLVHWYLRKGRYDPSRKASLKTFMARVVRNKIRDIVDLRMAQKRRDEINTISLDQLLGPEEDSRSLEEETPEEGGVDLSRDYASDVDRRLDVSRVLGNLTDQQRRICDLLIDGSLTKDEMAEKAGVHRSTLYDEIARIKRLFEREGFGNY